MTQAFEFASKTARFEIPLLYPGQAQKEFVVNEAFVLLDMLLQHSVISSQSTPPSDPNEGDAYRILSGATGDWSDHDGAIASWIGQKWSFFEPVPGMRVFDQAAGQMILFKSQWSSSAAPDEPTGGAIIDLEARATIAQLISILRENGLLASAS